MHPLPCQAHQGLEPAGRGLRPSRVGTYNLGVMRSLFHRLALHLALAAMVFVAAVPTLSHALERAAGSAGWVEVCTAQGSLWVNLRAQANADADPDGTTPAGGLVSSLVEHLDRCPCCLNAPSGMGLLRLSSGVEPAAGLCHGLPAHALDAAQAVPAWCAAQPRAPPGRA